MLGVNQGAGDETEVIRNLDGLVLALLGRLVVPPVAGNLTDEVGAGVNDAQPVGREQACDGADAVEHVVGCLGEIVVAALVQLQVERLRGRV